MEMKQCPTCDKTIQLIPRYPNAICNECGELAVTSKDEPIDFKNEGPFGGFISIINGKEGEEHECFVNGKKCWAEEGRFGFIVISVTQDKTGV